MAFGRRVFEFHGQDTPVLGQSIDHSAQGFMQGLWRQGCPKFESLSHPNLEPPTLNLKPSTFLFKNPFPSPQTLNPKP